MTFLVFVFDLVGLIGVAFDQEINGSWPIGRPTRRCGIIVCEACPAPSSLIVVSLGFFFSCLAIFTFIETFRRLMSSDRVPG